MSENLLHQGHRPAKCWRLFALNVISPDVRLPRRWSALSQHSLQVDLLPVPDLVTAVGRQAARSSTPMIEMTDLLMQLGHPSGVI